MTAAVAGRAAAGRAGAARAGAGRTASARRSGAAASGRSLTGPAGSIPDAEVTDELQRRRQEAADRKVVGAASPELTGADQPGAGVVPGSAGSGAKAAGRSGSRRRPAAVVSSDANGKVSVNPVRAANASGGFVLGLVSWVVVRAYLLDGPEGVKRLLRAKFFNEVSQ